MPFEHYVLLCKHADSKVRLQFIPKYFIRMMEIIRHAFLFYCRCHEQFSNIYQQNYKVTFIKLSKYCKPCCRLY